MCFEADMWKHCALMASASARPFISTFPDLKPTKSLTHQVQLFVLLLQDLSQMPQIEDFDLEGARKLVPGQKSQ